MDYTTTTALSACLLLFFVACEQPESPDFNLEQRVQAPIVLEQTYQFLGGSNALIDTTGEDFDSLFTVDGDGLVSLSRQEEFEFGDLDDAIPEVSTDPTNINSEVGEIELTDFSSGGNVGSAGFNEVTGLDPSILGPGDPIPAGNTPGAINIDFATDYFVSAVVKSGGVDIAFTNNLGFNIDDELNLTLKAGANVLDNESFTVDDGETVTWSISFAQGTVLEDLSIDFTASWFAQNMNGEPDNLEVNSITGTNLIASEVTAVIGAQKFSTSGTSTVDNSKFKFTASDHYIELQQGQLRIVDIVNQIDLGIEDLQISFPDIREVPYNASDSLVINMQVPANSNGTVEENIDLAGLRIYAEGNTVEYNITGTTEDLKAGSSPARTIRETDKLTATVELNNLGIREARGVIVSKKVLLNEDDAGNGSGLDLFSDQEAEIVSIDGLETLSEQIDGLEFSDPLLGISYNSNLDVATTIYAAIAGKSADGQEIYLSGKTGTEYSVSSSHSELRADGEVIPAGKLIRFELDRPENGEAMVMGLEEFNTENTNVDEFLNNLPTEIRFIGLASINENGAVGTVTDPVRFEPGFNVDLPLHFASETSVYSDTSETDLQDLPGEGDEQSLTEATVAIGYENGLPLHMELSLIMLDEQFREVTKIPLPNQDPISISGAPVDPETRFVTGAEEGEMVFSLNEQQLDILNRTRHMIVEISFSTTSQEEVKIRAEDSIALSIKMSVGFTTNIN